MIIRTKSLKDFIERAKIRHNNKYDYTDQTLNDILNELR